MAEGFGPRFKRLREKVDAWGKEYDEHRAADRAFLERDKARSEKARAEWKEHQARLKQRVKVFGRSGAKAEEKPTRGKGNGQTVTEVKKEPPNSQSQQPKFTQNNAPNYAWTDYKPENKPKSQSRESRWRGTRFDSGTTDGVSHDTSRGLAGTAAVAGAQTASAVPSAVSAGRQAFNDTKRRGLQRMWREVTTSAGKPVGDVWGKLNTGARNALVPKLQAFNEGVTQTAQRRAINHGGRAFLRHTSSLGSKLAGVGTGVALELLNADPISKTQDLSESARQGKVKLTAEQEMALEKNKRDLQAYYAKLKAEKERKRRGTRYDSGS